MSNLTQFTQRSFSRIDVTSVTATATLDLAASQVFRIDASTPRTLVFANPPAANRAMVVVLHIAGSAAIAWPASITWDSGQQPKLGPSFTRVVLLWDGVMWTGSNEVTR